MWLESKRQHRLTVGEPSDLIVPCRVNVRAFADFDRIMPGGRDSFIVGRILADEIHRFEIEDRGENVWDAADADSSGVEAAWASVLDENGHFRDGDFPSVSDPVVYVYRFELHPDFAEFRLAVMDQFCRMYSCEALILAQLQTTVFSETEFAELGFEDLPPTQFPAPFGFPCIDRKTRFKFRANCLQTRFTVDDYPDDAPPACSYHSKWVRAKGPWAALC